MFSHTSVLQSELKDTDLKTKAKLNTVLKIIFPIQSKFQTIGQLAPISQKFRGPSMNDVKVVFKTERKITATNDPHI